MKISKLSIYVMVLCLIVLLSASFLREAVLSTKPTIGLVAEVTETSSGLTFKALVDTGAGRCSMNCQEVEIENESEKPEENIGKAARILLVNEKGEEEWIQTRLVDYSNITNVDGSNPRYHVRLVLRCQGFEREVSVSLKNRSHMTFRMLLGRNFLKDNFVVDVSKDNPSIR